MIPAFEAAFYRKIGTPMRLVPCDEIRLRSAVTKSMYVGKLHFSGSRSSGVLMRSSVEEPFDRSSD